MSVSLFTGFSSPFQPDVSLSASTTSYGSVTQPGRWPGEQGNWVMLSPGPMAYPHGGSSPRLVTVDSPNGKITVEFEWGENEPPWFGRAIAELRRLLWLPRNWDSHASRPVDLRSAAHVLGFLLTVMEASTPLPQFVPAQRGGIQLEWHRRGIDFEVEFDSSGQISGLFEDKWEGIEWEEDLTNNKERVIPVLPKLSRPPR